MAKLSEIHSRPEAYAGSIAIEGWVKTERQSKSVGFIEITDGTSSGSGCL